MDDDRQKDSEALHMIGIRLHQQGQHERAIGYIRKAIALNDKDPFYFNNLGAVHRSLGKQDEAIRNYHRAIQIDETYAQAHYNLATLHHTSGCLEKSIPFYKNAIKNKADYLDAYNNLMAVLNVLGRFEEALDYGQKAVTFFPNSPELLNNYANTLRNVGRLKASVDCYRRSIQLSPKHEEVYSNLGNALNDIGKIEEAIACHKQAIAINPKYGKAYNNLGTIFRSQRSLKTAETLLLKAISLLPNDPEAYHNMGNIHYDRGDYATAIKWYQRSASLNQKPAVTLTNLGVVFQETGKSDEAVLCFQKAITLLPSSAKAHSHLFHEHLQRCDWNDAARFSIDVDQFTHKALAEGRRPEEMPFLNLIRSSEPRLNFLVAKAWSQEVDGFVNKEHKTIAAKSKNKSGKALTIGYLGNNLQNHPTAHLIWNLFSCQHRDRFRVFVYSYGADDGSIYRKRIMADCDKFVDIQQLSHQDAVSVIKADKVDILVDLVGYMRNNRLAIAAHRPAPIQVRWLGLAGTTGASFFDYLITDNKVTPEDQQPYYSERFAYMPTCYQLNSKPLVISQERFTRKKAGLPEDRFIFCCFCSNYKIDATVFQIWMDVLKSVPESILWIMATNSRVKANMAAAAVSQGVSLDRLVFAEKVSKADHLERLRLADLAFDTTTVNGAATTSDALWAGVPVITVKGCHFASRMSASILSAIGLNDLVFATMKDYLQMAISCGKNPSIVESLKQRLNLNRDKSPLFDTQAFVDDLENLFLKMWRDHQNGKRPRMIQVDSPKRPRLLSAMVLSSP